MIKRWLVRRAIRHQFANARKLLTGAPVSVAPLGGATLDCDDAQIATACLQDRQQWFGPEQVESYQSEFLRWNGSRHAYAFMGGRVALSACLYALELGPGDEVILPGYTCVVVPNALKFAGVTPVYCDIELDTYGLDAACVEAAITPKTRAILLQHSYGLVCRDHDALLELARRRGLAVIEDCAHATGAEHHGTKVGNSATVAFYSSEQSKVFSTIEGGIAVTNDDALAVRMREFWEKCPDPTPERIELLLRNVIVQYYRYKHPQRWWLGDVMQVVQGAPDLISTTPEEMQGLRPAGYGCRMASPIAMLGSNQIRKVDQYNAMRRRVASRWDDWCSQYGYRIAQVIPDSTPVYLRYPVMVEPARKRDVSWARRELRVELGVWYRGSLHPLEGVLPGLPRAAEAVASCVNLPCLIP